MNPLAVLSAIVGVAIFPGAAYAVLVATLVAVGGRVPAGLRPPQLDELMAAVVVSAACGLLAFPGSPLSGLPTGVSLVAFVIALAAGIAWGSAERWPWQRLAAGAAAVAPLLGLASVAMTLDLRTIAAAGGSVGAARPWAVTAVLMALPALVRPFDQHTARLGRAALVAAIGLACFSLAGFAPLAGFPALAVAGFGALAVLACAGLLGVCRRPLLVAGPAVGLLALVPAVISLGVALR
jgi:FtsH-binding integral membrane protein